MKIDILISENTYSTVLHFSQSLAAALEKQGVNIRQFWIGEGHFFHAFYEILADPPDLTCSFSDIFLNQTPLGDLWQIPHLTLLVDPPIYFLHQFKTEFGWISCVDDLDCKFVRDLGFSRAFFLPHAADGSILTSVHAPRSFDFVFFGTCLDYQEIENSWPINKKELLRTAAEMVLSNLGLSIAEVLFALGVPHEEFAYYHGEVDRYTRGKDRIALIRSLNEKVHIWGEGPWKKYFPDYAVYPSLPFDETITIMKQSKVVLNSSPRFKRGGHERIFYALMCGADVYTGENAYIKKEFPDLATYKFGAWEGMCREGWQSRAELSQQVLLARHTWDNRAQTLLNAVCGR